MSARPNLADTRQDLFWLAVIAFGLWVVVPNLPSIAECVR
jgi:hypothetical protein